MATTYRIAVIGDWESVMGFRAIGLDTYPVTSAAEAKERVKELAKDGECAVIYLTEQLAREMSDVLNHYKDELRPEKGPWASAGTTSSGPLSGPWARIFCKTPRRLGAHSFR